MKGKETLYLVEVGSPSLTEFIDEKYDSITAHMPPNAVIYGSALTSLISGLPADGDVDISVSASEYTKLTHSLQASTKWLQTEGDEVKLAVGYRVGLRGALPVISSRYEEIPDFPLEETVTFQDVNRSKVQIIKSKQQSGDPLDDALSVVRKVDFTFCGMAMDKYGRLMETIPHAYSDCCAGIIRMANYRAGEDPERIRDRINKYLKRGWHLSIDLDTIFYNMRNAKKPTSKESTTNWSKIYRLGVVSDTWQIKTTGINRTCVTATDILNWTSEYEKNIGQTFIISRINEEYILSYCYPSSLAGNTPAKIVNEFYRYLITKSIDKEENYE